MFSLFWGVVILSLLVFVHEGGHFLAARVFGMRVTEFYLGLPSRWRICRRSKKRGTEIGVTPLLLGGYNRICGMEGAHDELLAPCLAFVQECGRVSAADVAAKFDIDAQRAFDLLLTLNDWASIEPFYNEELGEHPNQRNYPEQFQTQQRDANFLTAYDAGHDFSLPGASEAGEPRPIACEPEAFLSQECGKTYLGKNFVARVITLLAGAFVNVLLAFLVVTLSLMLVGVTYGRNVNVVGEVEQGGIAQASGLQEGDTVTAVNGTQVDTWDSMHDALADAYPLGEDIRLSIERDGKSQEIVISLPKDQEVTSIGIKPPSATYHLSLDEAMSTAARYGKVVATVALRIIMPQHTIETLQNANSIVGITAKAGEAASAGVNDLLLYTAAISMSLGFMNLLPIPPLDGGKILIEVVQLVIRRPLSKKAVTVISYIGLAFFLFIFVFALKNDIVNLFFS